jgi:hypothetical protein
MNRIALALPSGYVVDISLADAKWFDQFGGLRLFVVVAIGPENCPIENGEAGSSDYVDYLY